MTFDATLNPVVYEGGIPVFIDTERDTWNLQVFIASHSYFVIKKLFLIAQKRKKSVSCISMSKSGPIVVSDLSQGMPKNSIIDASIHLYEQEVDEVL